MSVHSSVLELK